MAKSAQQVSTKWQRNASAAGQSYLDGVNGVTEAPGAKAASRANEYLAGVQRSVNKWQRNVGAVSLSEWKQRTATLGGQRYVPGVQAGASKYAAFASEFMPFVNQIKEELDDMPTGTLEESINKMAENVRRISQFRR